MVVGSGLLAMAFAKYYQDTPNVWIHAAGVSNSGCRDPLAFEREYRCLHDSLLRAADAEVFIYFGTCSVFDSAAASTPYVQHKLAMERLVSTHPRYLIVRLPQVAGQTKNPYTLLNFLHAHITQRKHFFLWQRAHRNIIDVDDITLVVQQFIADIACRQKILNVASPESFPTRTVVSEMEYVIGKPAIFTPLEQGAYYPIDVGYMTSMVSVAGVKFGEHYLTRVIEKYYGNR